MKKMDKVAVVSNAIASLSDSPTFTGLMSISEFRRWNVQYPSLMGPLKSMQAAYRRAVCGVSFWKALTTRRAAEGLEPAGVNMMRQLKKMLDFDGLTRK